MDSRKTTQKAVLISLPLLFFALTAASAGHSALPAGALPERESRCVTVGGSISTNLAVIDANTTLGTATGDLRGALAANILSISQVGNDTLFTVQHHWVTESGETLKIPKTTAKTTQVAPGLFAVIDYPLDISDGTGKFAGATGKLHLIGEVNLNVGSTVFRYSGNVCFADPD